MTTPSPLAARPAAKRTLKEQISSKEFEVQLDRGLPRHVSSHRFQRAALNALMREPKLAECTPASFFQCLLELASLGLEPDGRLAHLIPREDRKLGGVLCTKLIDYKGLVELIYRTGLVSVLHADVVRRGDLVRYSKGDMGDHVPWFLREDAARPREAGPIYAVYALAKMRAGNEKVDVMPLEDVLAIRDLSPGWIAFRDGYAKSSPWNPEFPVIENEMMKKTVLRRLSKLLPLSSEQREQIEADDEPFPSEADRFRAAKAVVQEEAGTAALSEALGGGAGGGSGETSTPAPSSTTVERVRALMREEYGMSEEVLMGSLCRLRVAVADQRLDQLPDDALAWTEAHLNEIARGKAKPWK